MPKAFVDLFIKYQPTLATVRGSFVVIYRIHMYSATIYSTFPQKDAPQTNRSIGTHEAQR